MGTTNNNDGGTRDEPGTPRVRLRDHLAVVGLLFVTLAQGLVAALYLPFGIVLGPLSRRRMRTFLSKEGDSRPDPIDLAGEDLGSGSQVFVVVGEASGDRLAAKVIEKLKARDPSLDIVG